MLICTEIFLSDCDSHTVILCLVTVSVNTLFVILLENAPPSPLDEYTKTHQTVHTLMGGGRVLWYVNYLNLKEN